MGLDFRNLDDDWAYANYCLLCVYVLLTICAAAQLARVLMHVKQHGREGIFFVMRVRLHLFLLLGCLSRTILTSLPVKFYDWLITHHQWLLQVVLDMTPEILFWLTYVLLVMLWAAMYYGTMNFTNRDELLKKIFLAILFSCVAVVLIMGGIMQYINNYKIIAEAIFLFVLSVCTVVAFLVYGSLLYLRAQKLTINATNKNSMLQKLKWIVIVVVICDLMHSLYLVIVDYFSAWKRPHYYIVIWFCYLFFTEILPAAIILFIFKKIPTQPTYTPLRDPPSYNTNYNGSTTNYNNNTTNYNNTGSGEKL